MSSMKHTVKSTRVHLKDPTPERKAKFTAALKRGISNYILGMNTYLEEITTHGRAGIGEVPFYTGSLHDSAILSIASSFATLTGFTAIWGFDKSKAPWGKWVNYGRPAGPAPIEEIKEWCRYRGIPEEAAYAIVNWKKKNITPGKHFFEPGIIHMKQVLRQQLELAFAGKDLQVKVNIK